MKNVIRKTGMVLLFFCVACTAKQQESAFHPQVDIKSKQKAALLQKRLDKAQRNLSEDQQTIELLRLQLCEKFRRSMAQQPTASN
jgi:hypothetical protein